MALFKTITDWAERFVKIGSKKIKCKSKTAALSFENRSELETVRKLYCEIGRRYYEDNGLNPGPGFEDLCDRVTAAKARITENKAQIEALNINGVLDDEVWDPETAAK